MGEQGSLTELLASLHGVFNQLDEIFLNGFSRHPQWREKGDRDPVSDIDLAIERRCRELLLGLTPEIPFVGEETGGCVPANGLAWVVDPVDGTVNFLERLPLCGISVGLMKDGFPILGLVSLPLLGTRFGGGPSVPSMEDGRPIQVADTPVLKRAVVAIGDYSTGQGAEAKNRRKLAVHKLLAGDVYRVRMLGSAAIDLVWLASGRLHGSITMSNNPWDMCAGVAIALGAGARVVGADGEPYSVSSTVTVAGTPQLVSALHETVRSVL